MAFSYTKLLFGGSPKKILADKIIPHYEQAKSEFPEGSYYANRNQVSHIKTEEIPQPKGKIFR